MREAVKIMVITVCGLCVGALTLWALDAPTLQYKTISEISGFNSPAITTQYFSKANKIRIESSIKGQGVVMIFDGANTYSYMPAQNLAVILPFSELSEQITLPDYKNDASFQRQGQELIEGVLCDIYATTGTKSSARLWVDPEIDFPLKVHNSYQGREMITRVIDIKKGESLDDALFELPQEALIVQIPSQVSWSPEAATEIINGIQQSDIPLEGVKELLGSALNLEASKEGVHNQGFSFEGKDLKQQLKSIEDILKDFNTQ